MSSTSSARRPAPKVQVTCDCGKKYRVPASKGGKKITCKACGDKIRVPRETAVSERSRGAILAELGIDAVAAEEAYKAEVERRNVLRSIKAYHCTRCESEIPATELKGAYVKGELTCAGCRATDEVADRKAEREKETRSKAAVEFSSVKGDPQKAMMAGLSYGALFFVGITLPLWLVVGAKLWVAFLVGAAIAGAGGGLVYRTRS